MDLGVCDEFALIVLGATFPQYSLFFFFLLFLFLTNLSAARSEWSSQLLTHWSVIHLRTQAATISPQESLYPLLPSTLSVYLRAPRQQPSRTPAPPWNRRDCACGTLARLGRFCLSPPLRETGDTRSERNLNALRGFEKMRLLRFNHPSVSVQLCQQFVEQRYFVRLGKTLRDAPLRLRAAVAWREPLKNIQICPERLFVH